MYRIKSPFVVLLVLSLVLVTFPQIGIVDAEPRTIVVPDDYPTIVTAVGNASEGDTIFVKNGIYSETIEINIPISLKGEDRENTIIEGFRLDYGQPPPVINIKAPNVTISGFTLTGSGNAGIKIDIRAYTDKGGCKITGNNIINNGLAIRTWDINHCIISNNTIKENGEHGIYFAGSDSMISNNNLLGKTNILGTGIKVDFSHNLTITKNQISGYEEGISLRYIEQNEPIYVYENNVINHNGYGIVLWEECNNSVIFKNNIANNGVGIYLKDVRLSENVGMYNQVFNNNIVDNDLQVLVDPISDIVSWDNGTQGNYWSDYEDRYPQAIEMDDAGIWKTPYVIDENNQDNYPLMQPVIIPEFPSLALFFVIFVAIIGVTIIYKRNLQKRGR